MLVPHRLPYLVCGAANAASRGHQMFSCTTTLAVLCHVSLVQAILLSTSTAPRARPAAHNVRLSHSSSSARDLRNRPD